MVATTLGAALARAAGVDFEVPEGGETIPVPGIAVVTGFFSVVGRRPRRRPAPVERPPRRALRADGGVR